MSKTKLLINLIEDIRSVADSLEKVSKSISSSDELKKEINKISLEEIRTILSIKSQEGYTEDIKRIIKNYGGSKLSNVDEKFYDSILKDVKNL